MEATTGDMDHKLRGEERITDGAAPPPARALDGSPDADVEQDDIFGLVSALYHALRGASASRKYIADARDADDPELQRFFERSRATDAARADEAKQLLVSRVMKAAQAQPVSEAAFAAGDGADDAAVSPGDDRGKVGIWPAL